MTGTELNARARALYVKLDAALDEIMRKVGGEHEQPPASWLIECLARQGITVVDDDRGTA